MIPYRVTFRADDYRQERTLDLQAEDIDVALHAAIRMTAGDVWEAEGARIDLSGYHVIKIEYIED